MIKRALAPKLRQTAKQFPVVTLTGPRQSGETILVQAAFKQYDNISLDLLDQRDFAIKAPFSAGAISQG
ncbi:MAG TPA: hypothetical protein ENF70_03535 [Deltaproteobacteria bacterium]|nr:hypothetical protein [Deltaproteobacteria bacterium]MBW2082917.1 hypothetical protein [Deltaproteobacteria bacterium]HDH98189.1 hypothetical protein [Deltaproteobacteria bacterium]